MNFNSYIMNLIEILSFSIFPKHFSQVLVKNNHNVAMQVLLIIIIISVRVVILFSSIHAALQLPDILSSFK